MRVCTNCGYHDSDYWKHVKWSYYIDGCSLENFKILEPQLAFNLKKGGDITEDEHYLYRLTKKGHIVLRKAKRDFADLSKRNFSDESFEKFDHYAKKKDWVQDIRPYWNRLHPSQKKLLEMTK